MLDVNPTTMLVIQASILLAWCALAVVALVHLRHRRLDETVRILWVIVILLLPVVGALAFFVVDPGGAD